MLGAKQYLNRDKDNVACITRKEEQKKMNVYWKS